MKILRSVSLVASCALIVGLIGSAEGAPRTCFGLNATIAGGRAADRLSGTPGPDVIASGGGPDKINGRGGDDVICSGGGHDVVRGGNGSAASTQARDSTASAAGTAQIACAVEGQE
jgi:Ca2+-binding RTX toxin-like protein